MPSPIHPSCWKNLTHSMEPGFATFVSPILVGGLRDISGSFIPGLAIAAAASWASCYRHLAAAERHTFPGPHPSGAISASLTTQNRTRNFKPTRQGLVFTPNTVAKTRMI